MAFVLAKLGPVAGGGQRQVWVRGSESVAAVLPSAARAREGDLVLLDGSASNWTVTHQVTLTPWPAQLPPNVGAMRQARRPAFPAALSGVLTSTGTWTLDPEGRPCEVGFGRGGGPVFAVVNYSGWKLSDLERGVVDVLPCSVDGHELWIITARAVPSPPPAEPDPAPRTVSPPAPTYPAGFGGFGRELRVAEPTAVIPPWHPPPAPAEAPFDLHLRFADLTFLEGSLQFRYLDQVLSVETEFAHEVYTDVRDDLDQELPSGVRAVGAVHRGGGVRCEIHGLEKLASIFHRVVRGRFIRSALGAPRWVDAEDLAVQNPDGGGRPDPASVLDIPEFNFGRRAEAFRRMFKVRASGEPVRVLPGRAVVVALAASDGGRPWFAWEKTTGDYATYVFRPSDDEQRDRMLSWTEDRENRRRDLLSSKALRAALGFVARVMHRDAQGDQLVGWWRRLMRSIGRSAGE